MIASKLHISRPETSPFEDGGLRAHYEYRDLGLAAATGGKVGAQVIRVRDARATSPAHRHALEFQMIYILKGWVIFDYDGTGEVKLAEGSCAYQPPGIRHAEIAHSDDLEILEITMPAAFATEAA